MNKETLEKFLEEYCLLIVSELKNRLNIEVEPERQSEPSVRFLLENAAILSLEDFDEIESPGLDKRAWAYDVATRLVESHGRQNETIAAAAEFILARLGNFPSRDLLRQEYTTLDPTILRSPALRLEALVRESENTTEYPNLGTRTLTDFQHKLHDSLERSRAVSVSAPTSAGKSFVLEHDIVSTLAKQKSNVLVYIVPTRALIQQVTGDVLKLLRSANMSGVVVSAAPVGFTNDQAEHGVVYILTQERLVSLLGNREFNLSIKKLYVDEAQEVGDQERGLILDSAIRQVIKRFPDVRTCFASPLTRNPGYLFEQFDITKEGEFFTETLSPVSQVIVNLHPINRQPSKAKVIAATPLGMKEVGEAELPFKLRGVWDALAGTAKYVRQENESAIVFANRPHDAMQVAETLSNSIKEKSDDSEVLDLIRFVKAHVHPRYSLADALEKGVAFHYGKMPHVVRSKIEDLLRKRKLSYVVSTSTLLQGVNLPARHIVVLNPKQGNKSPMTPSGFWNLVGRAGRLKENFRGIVWCIDPENWDAKPFDGERLSEIKSAFHTALEDTEIREAAIAVLDGTAPVSMVKKRNQVEQFIGKSFCEFTLQDIKLSQSSRVPDQVQEEMIPLENRLDQLRANLKVPESVCLLNEVIAPTLLDDLWSRFSNGITEEMIPIDPIQKNAINHFKTVFEIIDDVFIGSGNNSWKYFSTLGYFWIMGWSLRELIDNRLDYYKVRQSNVKAVNKNIREILEDIEQTLRFTYVKYLKAYIDVLKAFLLSQDKEKSAESLAPWDLYMEFGARDRVLLQLMSVGVSRSTSILIRRAITNEAEISREECWGKLEKLPLRVLDIPEICKEEVRVLTGNSK